METSGPDNIPDVGEGATRIPPKKKGGFLGFLKTLLLLLILIAIIIASFWVSFLLGKRILVPVKEAPERKFEVSIQESQPTPQAMQRLEEIMLEAEEGEAAEPVKVEPKKVAKALPTVSKGYSHTVKQDQNAQHYYKVVAEVFSSQSGAAALAEKLQAGGFATYIRRTDKGYRVQVGAFYRKSDAQRLQGSLRVKGFQSTIIYE